MNGEFWKTEICYSLSTRLLLMVSRETEYVQTTPLVLFLFFNQHNTIILGLFFFKCTFTLQIHLNLNSSEMTTEIKRNEVLSSCLSHLLHVVDLDVTNFVPALK